MGLTAESLQVENKNMKNVQMLDMQKPYPIIDTATQRIKSAQNIILK